MCALLPIPTTHFRQGMFAKLIRVSVPNWNVPMKHFRSKIGVATWLCQAPAKAWILMQPCRVVQVITWLRERTWANPFPGLASVHSLDGGVTEALFVLSRLSEWVLPLSELAQALPRRAYTACNGWGQYISQHSVKGLDRPKRRVNSSSANYHSLSVWFRQSSVAPIKGTTLIFAPLLPMKVRECKKEEDLDKVLGNFLDWQKSICDKRRKKNPG